ncbi:MAG: RND family transporter [Desulfobacterales bacterium]|nr:RND family transporter [Desulfobacteraceae bacterium]MBT7086918.1 RND family transporter [Desulfobacterales bacterium]
MKTLSKIIIKFAPLFIILNIVITCFFAYQLPKVKTNNELDKFLPENNQMIIINDYLKENYGSGNAMFLAIEAREGTIYKKSILKKIAQLTEDLEMLDNVEEVTSLSNVDNIVGVEDGMEVDPIFDPYEDIDEDVLSNVKKALDSWDFYKGNIINKKANATAIIIEFPKLADIETKAVLHTDITKLMNRSHFPEANLYLAGRPSLEVEMGNYMYEDLKATIPFVIIVLIIVLFLSFRSFSGVFFPMLCVIIATVNSMGLMGYLGIEISLMGTIIPVTLTAVGSAYSIHVVRYYFIAIKTGISKKEAVEETFKNVGLSVILAGVTTMCGFGSLSTSSVTPIKEFGIFVAVGTGVALLVSLTFIPPLILFFVKSGRPEKINPDKVKDRLSFIERLIYQTTRIVMRNYRAVIVFGVILVILSIISSTRLVSYNNMIEDFPKDSKIRIANNWINNNFTGTTDISILLTGKNDSIKEPEVLRQIENLQNFVEEKYPFVTKSVSIADFIKRMNVAMNANNPEFDKIPSSKELIAQYLLLYSTSGDPDDFDPYVDYDYKEARILFMSTRSRSTENLEVLNGIKEYTDKHIGPDLKVQISGNAAITNTLSKLIMKGLLTSIIASMIVVFLLMTFIYRSIFGGILSVLPLSLAILINFAIMPIFGIPLNIPTSIVGSVAVGVGIDYAIHYINNARLNAGNYYTIDELYLHTSTTSGTSIFFNALAVTAGFLVLLFSNFIPFTTLGFLVALTMVTSALGSLIFIPAILKVYKPKFIKLKTNAP